MRNHALHSARTMAACAPLALLLACSPGGSTDGTVAVSARALSLAPGDAPAHDFPALPPGASLRVTLHEVRLLFAGGAGADPGGGHPEADGDIEDDGDGGHGIGGRPDLDVGPGNHGRPDGGAGQGGRDAGVSHKPDGGKGGEEADGGDDEGGWHTVFSGSVALDLLDPAADAQVLGSIAAPAGRILQVRLVLDGGVELVAGGVSTPVACPSCTTSGLKVVLPGGLTVAPGATLGLSIDFDAFASLVGDAVSGYRLSPVIRISTK